MKAKELAYALGISAAMVSKLAKRGMPTDSIEAAEKWRKRHLDQARVKQHRMNGGRSAEPKLRIFPVGSAAIAQAIRTDPDPFDTFIRGLLPAEMFDPLAVAAILSDAGLCINGGTVLRLAAGLYLYYMHLIDPAEEMGCIVPSRLKHRPGSPEFEAVARQIDECMAKWNAPIAA